MDKTVTEAEGELESFLQNKMIQLASQSLLQDKDQPTSLDVTKLLPETKSKKKGGYTLKPKLQPRLEKILAGLTEQEKDDIYSHLRYQHVLQDCYDFCEQEDLSASDEILEHAATFYVYDGDYDCNLPYWSNIANVIEKASN